MKIGICGGGDVTLAFDTSLSYIGVDRGIATLNKQGITPILGVGDFDSLEDKTLLDTLQIARLPVKKDITDTEYALQYAIEQGYTEIYIYGVTGGRMDHFMAIMSLLQKYATISIFVLDAHNKIYVLPAGEHNIEKSQYTYFSLFSFDKSTVSIHSAQYPLQQYILDKKDPLCVSNRVMGEQATVMTDSLLLCIESRDKRYSNRAH